MAKRRKKGILRVGTSNIVLPGPKHTFPEEYQSRSRLCYYATLFNTLEVNSTFYKLPRAKTFEAWAADVPEDFRFTVKLWREVTHAKGLEFNPLHIDQAMEAANHLGDKRGSLLVQFPGSITVHQFSKVAQILERVQQHNTDEAWKVALEFRHNSWYRQETYDLLKEFGAAMVLQDMPKSRTPMPEEEPPFVYIRFHGPDGNYRGGYEREVLEGWAWEIEQWLDEGKEVYVYFNNTAGEAFGDARELVGMVK